MNSRPSSTAGSEVVAVVGTFEDELRAANRSQEEEEGEDKSEASEVALPTCLERVAVMVSPCRVPC